MGDLRRVADELYGLPPAEFTGARNSRAARAKTEGDAALAAAVKALPKPVVAAWVVNLMVRQLPDRVRELLDLGAQLRDAQLVMDATSMRALTVQRRRLTAAVAREGADVAAELGQGVSPPVVEKVQATLHAAMIDAAASDAVRTGLLVRPLEATGTEVDLAGALAVEGDGALRRTADPDAPVDLAARRAEAKARAARELTEARAELGTAERTYEATQKAHRAQQAKVKDLQAQVLQARAELEELLRAVAAAEATLEPLADSLGRAQDAAADTDALGLAAKAKVEAAKARVSAAEHAARR